MAELSDFKMYLDEKFKRLESKIDSNKQLTDSMLAQIHEQTLKTNGRVTENESRIETLKNHQTSFYSLKEKLDEFERLQKKYEAETEGVRFFAKNHRLLKYAIVGFVILNLSSVVAAITVIVKFTN